MENLTVVNYADQRVLTTKQLAEIYETDENNIRNNFTRNQKYFVEGKHYYLLKGAELREFKNCITNSDTVKNRARYLYLWTERGANRHCKILDTDKAWEQFDVLEETYFHVKERAKTFKVPTTFSEALRLAADVQEENEKLKEQEKLLTPKAAGYDLIVSSGGTQSMNNFAKSMNWGRNRLYKLLREKGVFIKNATVPKQQYLENGYFVVKQCFIKGNVYSVTFITPKGMDFIVKKVQEWGMDKELLARN